MKRALRAENRKDALKHVFRRDGFSDKVYSVEVRRVNPVKIKPREIAWRRYRENKNDRYKEV